MTASRPRRPGALRRLAGLLLATAAAGLGPGLLPALAPSLAPALGPRAARAATPDLTFVTATTYEVLPDEGRVAATVRITATNHLKDTTTRRFFFEEGFLSVLPGTSNFAISGGSGSPSVAVSSRSEGAVVLRLRFGARLAAGQSAAFTLTFDLVDPGGAPDRPVRISPSLVRFQAWAFASDSTPGSSVEVVVPPAYTVEVGRGPLGGPTPNAAAWQVFTSGPLETPLTFVADIFADRPAEYVDGRRSATVGGRTVFVVIRAWPDDAAWRERVSDVVLRALPVLGEEIGAPWPFDEPLTVAETLTRGSGGYVGIFDPGQTLIQVSYLASPGVILHEAAHGWFNGRLVADRWIAEAFASLAAEGAAGALGLAIESPELEDALLDAAFPLNAWPPLGEATRAEDDYGLAASLALAREIAALVGDEALRATWAAAAAGVPAYQPPRRSATEPGTESGAPPPDWRALLDLLEENADPDVAADLERIWRRWVIRPEDAALLEARAEARDAYEAAVTAANPWALPRAIRDAMRSWQFEAALGLMRDADAVLRQRAAVEEAAAADDLRPPDTLRVAFEGDGGLPSAAAEAAAEFAAIAHIRAAEAVRIAEPGPFDRLGLIGLDPGADLAAARAAFEAGDQDRAVAAAAEAQATWEAVPGIARGRMIGASLLGAAVLLAAWLVAQRRHRQRVT